MIAKKSFSGMVTLICLLFIFISLITFAQQKVILYKDYNYSGNTRDVTGNVPDLSQSPWYFDKMVSSLKLQGVSVIAVYDQPNFNGKCEAIRNNIQDMRNTIIGNDKISSIKFNTDCGTAPAVILYENSNFGGKQYRVDRNYANLAYVFDDKASSLRLDGAKSVSLFDRENFQGNCETFYTNTPNLGNTNIEHDTVSSVLINSDCPKDIPYAILYQDKNFSGRTVRLMSDTPDLNISKFNDKLSSIKLYNGARLAVYEDTNYMGKCETVTDKTVADFSKTTVGNDKASSIKMNTACEKFTRLEIRNNSAAIIAFWFDGYYPDTEHRKLSTLRSHVFNLQPKRPVTVVIQFGYPSRDLIDWEEKCRYTIPMDKDAKVVAKGTLFNPHCDLQYE